MRLPLDHLSLQLFIQTECPADAPELAQGTEESLERCAWAGLSAAKPTTAAGPSGLWVDAGGGVLPPSLPGVK